MLRPGSYRAELVVKNSTDESAPASASFAVRGMPNSLELSAEEILLNGVRALRLRLIDEALYADFDFAAVAATLSPGDHVLRLTGLVSGHAKIEISE